MRTAYRYIAGVTPSPAPSPWDSLWTGLVGVIPGVLTVVLGALIIWGARVLYQRLSQPKPDFVLTGRFDMGEHVQLELKRVGKRPAFAVGSGEGLMQSSSVDSMILNPSLRQIGDLGPGEIYQFSLQVGSLVWLTWVDRKRFYSRSVKIESGMAVDIHGVLPSSDGSVRT